MRTIKNLDLSPEKRIIKQYKTLKEDSYGTHLYQEVQKEIGSTVKVQGFIENLRNSKYMAFIVLKDITGKLQITVEKADHPDLVDTIDKLTPDSVITVTAR